MILKKEVNLASDEMYRLDIISGINVNNNNNDVEQPLVYRFRIVCY